MLDLRIKQVYFALIPPFLQLNAALYRVFRAPRAGDPKVHLGPGQSKYLEGWINVDANIFTAKCDVWADIRFQLPFRPGTIGAFYSHHVIEHLPDPAAHFRDVFRCLKPGGVYRVGVPNGDSVIRKYVEGDMEWLGVFPQARRSLGGRLDTRIFCNHEHLSLFTLSYLDELMTDAGFSPPRQCLPTRETLYPGVFDGAVLGGEWESDFAVPHNLIVEARKCTAAA